MAVKYSHKGERLYPKIFLSIIICIVMTMLILSTFQYINIKDILLDKVYNYNLSSLTQISADTRIMTETAKSLSRQIFMDLSISKLLYYNSTNVYDIGPARAQLRNYRLSLPFISSIYVYNARTGVFYMSSTEQEIASKEKHNMDDKGIVDIIDNIRDYRAFYPIPRTYTSVPLNFTLAAPEIDCYTFLCYDTLSNNEVLDGTVIVNISQEWIHNIIKAGTGDTTGDTFILNGKGVVASDSISFPFLTDLSSEGYIQQIMEAPLAAGYFWHTVNNVESLITYTAADELGWRYIRITPYSVLFQEIEHARNNIVMISIAILGIGLLIAFFISRNLYTPISTAFSKLTELEGEMSKNVKILKNETLKKLILHSEGCDMAMEQKAFKDYGIPLDPCKDYRLLLIKIDNYNLFIKNNDRDDQDLLKFAIMNIAVEITEQLFPAESVDMGDDHMVLFMNVPAEHNTVSRNLMESNLRSIQSAVLSHLKLSISLTVSRQDSTVKCLHALYNQVIEASFHRLFMGHGCVLFAEELLLKDPDEYIYPSHKEKAMIDALMEVRTNDVKTIYGEIIRETTQYALPVVNLAISHLVFTVNNAISIIRKNNCIEAPLILSASAISLYHVETIEEINSRFFMLFDEISRKLEEKKSMRHESLIQKINHIVRTNYMDPDLSPCSISDLLGMNQTYITRIYKQYTLKTILDEITEVRMNKAKDFLADTDYTIAEVSEKVGFANSSYFYKAFKKKNGVTPNIFRSSIQQ